MRSMLIALGDRRVALQDEDKKQKGFTLIELLVVVIIIGILAAIAIPIFLSQREGAWKASVESDVKNATLAVETWATSNNGSAKGLAKTALSIPDTGVTTPIKLNPSSHNTIIITTDLGTTGNDYTISGTNSDLGTGSGKTLTFDSTTGKQTWK